ncbi:calmodulin-like protein [Dunaliella salina]|uniref:Calmodulin-like protein n=1 Tax=Dunaliella salina TaxID=3046 RepID=A0ABQ7H2G8_DUNSA|nr:calmodulin-like protein [Dunaliella salina]|eukprot:KAF5841052.1 calmodulin-like protein [Dunaliella salina]
MAPNKPNPESRKMLKEITEAFREFDTDKDGRISTKDLGKVLCKQGENPSEQELIEAIKELDFDNNGTVDLPEFYLFNARVKKEMDLEEEGIREAFKSFDVDGNGYITPDEFGHVMSKLGEKMTYQQAKQTIKNMDQNNNGKINYEEFLDYMRSTDAE